MIALEPIWPLVSCIPTGHSVVIKDDHFEDSFEPMRILCRVRWKLNPWNQNLVLRVYFYDWDDVTLRKLSKHEIAWKAQRHPGNIRKGILGNLQKIFCDSLVLKIKLTLNPKFKLLTLFQFYLSIFHPGDKRSLSKTYLRIFSVKGRGYP